MLTFKQLMVGVMAAASVASAAADGASILGDEFQLTASVPDQGVMNQSTSGTAAVGTMLDLQVPPPEPVFGFEVSWVDEDTFVLRIRGFLGQDLNFATLELSGLDFRMPGSSQTVAITGASFNTTDCIPGTCFKDYFQSEGNPTALPFNAAYSPQVSFTDSSVRLFIQSFPDALVSDQIPLRFDVQTAAVPEPDTLAMVLAGLGLLALGRRRAA